MKNGINPIDPYSNIEEINKIVFQKQLKVFNKN